MENKLYSNDVKTCFFIWFLDFMYFNMTKWWPSVDKYCSSLKDDA